MSKIKRTNPKLKKRTNHKLKKRTRKLIGGPHLAAAADGQNEFSLAARPNGQSHSGKWEGAPRIMMIEHLQAFSITETDPESQEKKELKIEYQINLGRYFGASQFTDLAVFPDLIRQFNETQFNYMANLLASRT